MAVSAFSVPASRVSAAARASTAMMADKPNNTPAKFVPKGPFGGYVKVGENVGEQSGGWLGDQSSGTQIGKFEKGEDYLFFQGPAPKTAVQEDLPSFFSFENLADAEIKPIQIVVTGVGLGTFAITAAIVIGIPLPF